MDTASLLGIVQILVVPITITIAILLLRPFLRDLLRSFSKVEFKPISFELLSEVKNQVEETAQAETQSDLGAVTSRPSPRQLIETPRDKLEKLRLVLESEQINQLVQYHANSLAQSRISFWFSIGAATFGFLVIVVGVLLYILVPSNTASYLSVASGTIIDAVATLFFVQSNQARKSMTEFFDKLRSDRKFNESLRLSESITDQHIQSMLKALLSLSFSGMPTDSEFVKLLQLINLGAGEDKSTPEGVETA